MRATTIIGIAGPSGSGKSTLAHALSHALHGTVEIMSLDSYYLPLDHLTPAERALRNFDHPDAVDWPLFLNHLSNLKAGNAVEEPVYRFDLHTRSEEDRLVRAGDFVIVEGILAFHHEDARGFMDLRVFIETGDEECYRRRLQRDTRERGRSIQSVERQYTATVRPMAARYVWPTRETADLVVSGVEPVERAVGQILDELRLRTGQSRT